MKYIFILETKMSKMPLGPFEYILPNDIFNNLWYGLVIIESVLPSEKFYIGNKCSTVAKQMNPKIHLEIRFLTLLLLMLPLNCMN